MGARSLFIGTVSTVSICLIPGSECAQAQTATDTSERLPAIEVISPGESARPARNRTAPRATRNVRRVFVYPTAPTPTAGSGMDVDKVPAAVNAFGARQIERTGSLNIADALQQQVPGIVTSEVTGNPFQPDIQFRGFVASPVAGTPQGLAVYQNGMRINEAFGDTVNWDLIPTAAIQVGHGRDQQSRFRPQCAGRSRQRADEGWLQLSGCRDRHDGRFVRTHPEFGAVGQADRQFFGLWRARRTARRRISQFLGIRYSPFLRRCRLQDRQQRISCQHGCREQQVRRGCGGAGRTAPEILGGHLHHTANLGQPRWLSQSYRKGRGHADLDDRRLRRGCACSSRRRWMAIRPRPSHAPPTRGCFASTTTSRRPTASTESNSPIPSLPMPCWGRSTGPQRARRRRAEPCRRPTPTSCSDTTINSWSAPVSIPA